MERKFELATTRDINGLTLNCYRENGQDDLSGEFWMTREQIGQLLEYELPRRSIAKIHERNKERIDRFSRVVKMTTHEEKRDVIREVTIYNFKGLLEICRYSTQPNAHKVIDILWDIADEIRRTGMYVTTQALLRLEERVSGLERQLADDQAYTTLGRVIMSLPGSVSMQSGAQFLCEHGIPTGQNRLYKYCREKKLLCSRRGKQYNKPTQNSIERGLFNLEVSGGFHAAVMITPRGLKTLTEMLSRETYPLILMMETAKGETEPE